MAERLKPGETGTTPKFLRAVDAHFLLLKPKPDVRVRWHDFLTFVRLTPNDEKRLDARPEVQKPYELVLPFHIDHLDDPMWSWESLYKAWKLPPERTNKLIDRTDEFLKKMPRQEPVKKDSDEYYRLFGRFEGNPREVAALLTIGNQDDVVALWSLAHKNLPLMLEMMDEAGALPAFSRDVISGMVRLDAPFVSSEQNYTSPHQSARISLIKGVAISMLKRIKEARIADGIPTAVAQNDDDGRIGRALEAKFHHRFDTPFPRRRFAKGENLLPEGSTLINNEDNIGYEHPLSAICRERIVQAAGASGPAYLPPIINDRLASGVLTDSEIGGDYSLIM